MDITIKEVSNRKELKAYIFLPEKVHKGHANWVHPIYMDEWDYYNPKKNESFAHCDTILLLAYRGEKVVGRIMGLINHQYNDAKNEKHGRFNYLETFNDQDVAHALLLSIENWARENGMIKIVGPFAFSDKDPQGYLTMGFDEPMVIAAHGNYPYMIDILEKQGYKKEADLVAYKVIIPKEDPEIYTRISERTMRNNPQLRLLEFTSRRKLRPLIKPVLELLNRTFVEIYGFAALSEREMKNFANRYLIFINPRLVKVIIDPENVPVGFIIGMAEIGKGIQRCRGRILPFGLLKIFQEAKRTKQMTLLLGGIDKEYRGRGLDTLMALK
ncbi:MAG: hypothetical protein KAH17_09365, partial [Bacteroidales bacterium]|nr:hypothetical protein [Bacteroidales bacterium]